MVRDRDSSLWLRSYKPDRRSGVTTKDDHFFPGWNVTRKKKAKKGIPHLPDGMKFDRTLQEVPEQGVAAREPDSLV